MHKKEINFINSEIELAKIFIEITKKEIELKMILNRLQRKPPVKR